MPYSLQNRRRRLPCAGYNRTAAASHALFCRLTLSLCFLFSSCKSANQASRSSALIATPAAVVFTEEPVGSPTSQIVTLTNTGAAPVTVTQVTASPQEFQIQSTWNLPMALGPGSSASFAVTFTPDQPQAFHGTVTVLNDGPAPAVMSLTGNGVASAPVASVAPANLSFSNARVGAKESQPLTVTNSGNSPLSITEFKIEPAAFQLQPNFHLPIAVRPGLSATFIVNFKPDSTQSYAGSLTIITNASPVVVHLTGAATTAQAGSSGNR